MRPIVVWKAQSQTLDIACSASACCFSPSRSRISPVTADLETPPTALSKSRPASISSDFSQMTTGGSRAGTTRAKPASSASPATRWIRASAARASSASRTSAVVGAASRRSTATGAACDRRRPRSTSTPASTATTRSRRSAGVRARPPRSARSHSRARSARPAAARRGPASCDCRVESMVRLRPYSCAVTAASTAPGSTSRMSRAASTTSAECVSRAASTSAASLSAASFWSSAVHAAPRIPVSAVSIALSRWPRRA